MPIWSGVSIHIQIFFVIRKYAIQMVTAKTTPAYFIGPIM